MLALPGAAGGGLLSGVSNRAPSAIPSFLPEEGPEQILFSGGLTGGMVLPFKSPLLSSLFPLGADQRPGLGLKRHSENKLVMGRGG